MNTKQKQPVKQDYKVLKPFPLDGKMVADGTVSLTERAAAHLLAGGKIAKTTETKAKVKQNG